MLYEDGSGAVNALEDQDRTKPNQIIGYLAVAVPHRSRILTKYMLMSKIMTEWDFILTDFGKFPRNTEHKKCKG